MNDKSEFIILPPDFFHLTLRDRMSDARCYIKDVLEVIKSIRQPSDRLIIKYRTENQRRLFPTDETARVGYGKILDFCLPHTIVIGMPNSATWECLLNDISYYSFMDFQRIEKNKLCDKDSITRLSKFLYIAQNKEELLYNILQRRIYRHGILKKSLIFENGSNLNDIISIILTAKTKGNP